MVLDNLKFWKRKDEPFPENFGTPQWNAQPMAQEAPQGFSPEQPQQFGQTPGFESAGPQTTFAPQGGLVPTPPTFPTQQPLPASPAPEGHSHELEIISAKLDTIKAQLENVSTRLSHLERIAEGEQQAPKGW